MNQSEVMHNVLVSEPTSGTPLLSIITIMWNARDGFLMTADSLVGQMPDWCEWVVVDGASTDGVQEDMQRLGSHITRSVSEPDKGIADAFNKGVRLARGRYVLFLNAGDVLMPGALSELGDLLTGADAPPVVVGHIRMGARRFGRSVSFPRQLMRNYLPHQAMLIRRGLFRLLGEYDVSYRLGMDYEWSLRLKPFWSRIAFVPQVLAEMEPGGVSMTRYQDTYDQYHRARQKHCGFAPASRAVSGFFKGKVWLGRRIRGALARQKTT